MKNKLICIPMLIIICLFYHIKFGLETIIPTNINWIMSSRGDLTQHYLGWAFYSKESWDFPLGRIESIYYP